jgi:arylsulfatase A-like enzyme
VDPEGKAWASADDVNAAFLDWLPRREGRRFAAYLHYMEPHDPYTPPTAPAAPAACAADRGRVGPRRADNDQLGRARAAHRGRDRAPAGTLRGEVASWDRAFGRLVNALQRAGVAGDTIVVVTADHGEEFQEHGRLTHGSHLYDESIRVPLISRGPASPWLAGRISR